MLATSSIVGVPAGVAAGQYRIRVTADPADAVVEAVETNNSATTGIVTITPPELSIQSLSVPGTGIAGRSVGIPNTVVNTAAAPGTAPSFQVGLYLASSGGHRSGHRHAADLADRRIAGARGHVGGDHNGDVAHHARKLLHRRRR